MIYRETFVFGAQELYDMVENKRKEEKAERLEKAYEWIKKTIKEYCLPKAKLGFTETIITLTDDIKNCMAEVRETLECLGYKVSQKERYTFVVSWRQ